MEQPAPQRLGDVLVESGAIDRATLEQHTLNLRGLLGRYLTQHGLISGRALTRALAKQHRLALVDFQTTPPDRHLYRPRDLAHYQTHHYVPYAVDGRELICATSEPSSALIEELRRHHQRPVRLVVTGPHDLAEYYTHTGATAAARYARHTLRRQHRHLTAARTLYTHQWRGLLLVLFIPTLMLTLTPHLGWQLILLACNLFYFLCIYLKLQLYTQGQIALFRQRKKEASLANAAQALRAEELPVYSILVPLYMEAETTLKRLITSLSALDYPPEKLDIKLICETDDPDTIATLKALRPPQRMEIVTVAPSQPRTKPKACNVALGRVRGEYLVIYDAEDQPAPDQLRRAVVEFNAGESNLACLQASLNYYNRDENLLTQLFAIEYSALFRLSLPALEQLHIPIPLGGTSNHLRVSALKAVGGWDAFNVTEDADLGVRLAYFGYRTRVLTSLTLEEAPITLRAWMKQRTRWIKGYIQTWLVYTRDRRELKRRLGPLAYYGFQLFIGAPALTFLLAPLFWVIFIVSFTGIRPAPMFAITQLLCIISLFGGIGISLLYARAVLALEGWYTFKRAMLVYPFYWLLHSIAAGKALVELATKPHYWAKTRHGVSRVVNAS